MIGRYDLLSELGTSSMGVVYAAVDRLTGTRVALRLVTAQVLAPGSQGAPTSRRGRQPPGRRLQISRQLKLIASLRHPKIASVIDYGFDEEMRPFYTSRWIEQPEELLVAASSRPLAARLDLLIQILQGLTYLHRHGAVHGDLRSRTALVDGSEVRLVNFGLTALRDAETDADVAYLAPEILSGGVASPAADLYAVGVLAHALLAADGVRASAETVAISGAPTISTRDFEARAIPVLERLLALDPAERYGDAAEVIRDLVLAYDQPYPEETAEIRESFLQAARFVGRKGERLRLGSLLEAALESRGTALIVAGESGVGKSRLLEELRLMSLAEGAWVLQGRARAEGLGPYHCWRDVLRHLCLWVDVEDEAAAVLEHQVSGIGALLGREVGAASVLDPLATRQRFEAVVRQLFSQIEQPMVVLLEDLHWAGSESITLLLELFRITERLPLLLVGAFRDDERPDLSVVLAEIPQLKLERIDRQATVELAESILGPLAGQPGLADFLYRETGGNTFFLVEVVRALAEEAGRLDRIDAERLPAQITTGGIERILKRRLDRLPRRVKPLLRLAAVVGSEIDLKLLSALAPELQPALWLRFCSDQAVLEAAEGQWRFTSDRFREALIQDLSAEELRASHRRVAEAYAATYSGDSDPVTALAHHWAQAADLNDPEATRLAVDYLEKAGSASLASCATREAEQLYRRSHELLGTLPAADDQQEIRLLIGLGGVYLMSRGYTVPEVGQAFGRARSLCLEASDTTQLMPALLGLWRFHITRAELERARRLAEEMVDHAQANKRPSHRMLAEYAVGATILFQGDPQTGSRHLQAAIDLYAKLRAGSRREIAAAAFYLGQHPGVASLDYAGWAMWLLGYPEHAVALNQRGLAMAEALSHPFSLAFAWLMRAWLDHLRDDPSAAENSAATALELSRTGGFPNLVTASEVFQGWACARLGRTEGDTAQIQSALSRMRASGSELFRPSFLALLADAYSAVSRSSQGVRCLEEAIAHVEGSGSGYWEAELHRQLGELCLGLPRPNRSRAEASFRRAIQLAHRRAERSLELRALVSLARLENVQGRPRAATLVSLREVYQSFSEGLDTPDLIAARRLL